MSASAFVDFLERKLITHEIRKVVPPVDVLVEHAQQVLERDLINRALEEIQSRCEAKAKAYKLPMDLREQVTAALESEPDQPWDVATAEIVGNLCNESWDIEPTGA